MILAILTNVYYYINSENNIKWLNYINLYTTVTHFRG